ncbi:MAG: GNAT family N-acetyltransferase, partial [Candidatus Omnitrophota bacterium]
VSVLLKQYTDDLVELQCIWLHPFIQRQGYGARMCERVLKFFKDRGFGRIRLDPNARGFWQKFGIDCAKLYPTEKVTVDLDTLMARFDDYLRQKAAKETIPARKKSGKNSRNIMKIGLIALTLLAMPLLTRCDLYGPVWKPSSYEYGSTGLDNLYEVTDALVITQPHYVYKRDGVEIFIYDLGKGYVALLPHELKAIVDALNRAPICLIRGVPAVSVKEPSLFTEDGLAAQMHILTNNIVLYAIDDAETRGDGRRLYGHHEMERRIDLKQKGIDSSKTLVAGDDIRTIQGVVLHEAAHVLGHELERKGAEAWESFKDLNERSGHDDSYSDYARPYGETKVNEDWATIFEEYVTNTDHFWERAVLQARKGYPILLEKILLVSQFFLEEDAEQLRTYGSGPGDDLDTEFWPVQVVDNSLRVGKYSFQSDASGIISGVSEWKTSEIKNLRLVLSSMRDYSMETLEGTDGASFVRFTATSGASTFVWNKRAFCSRGDYVLFEARGKGSSINFPFDPGPGGSQPSVDPGSPMPAVTVHIATDGWETFRIDWSEDFVEMLAVSILWSVDIRRFDIHHSGGVFPGQGVNAGQFIDRINGDGAIVSSRELEPARQAEAALASDLERETVAKRSLGKKGLFGLAFLLFSAVAGNAQENTASLLQSGAEITGTAAVLPIIALSFVVIAAVIAAGLLSRMMTLRQDADKKMLFGRGKIPFDDYDIAEYYEDVRKLSGKKGSKPVAAKGMPMPGRTLVKSS